MKIKPYDLKKNSFKNWNEIFKNPAPIEIQSFKTGVVTIDLDGTLNPNHPNSPRLSGKVDVPIMAHLVSHRDFGDFLFDTGLDKSYYGDVFGGIETPLKEEFYQDKNENLGYYLKDTRSKLKAVYLSHLHPDHIAGLRDLSGNIPVVVAKGEMEDYQPKLYGDFLGQVKNVYEIDFSSLDDIYPLGKSADLLGDGSLWAVSTPGHTRGHVSFVVNGTNGPSFLTMDAAFIQENIRYGVAPVDYTWNVDDAQKTLDRIEIFLKMFQGVKIITGHEIPDYIRNEDVSS